MNTKSQSNPLYTISDGPSRDFLIDAFKYSYDGNTRLGSRFHLDPLTMAPMGHPGYTVTNLHITTISHEDDSGQSFIFTGWCYVDLDGCGSKLHNFDAYYNAKSREGHMQFKD